MADAIRVKGGTGERLVWPLGYIEAVQNIGGGGGGLNFEVVGGTAQPANPKENTIWIVTEQEVTGWVISSLQPDGMTDGSVWIKTVTAYEDGFEVDAVEENKLIIYVKTASQWQSGTFEDVPIKIFQNGEWIFDANVYLFVEGEGWQVEYHKTTDTGVSINVGSDKITVSGSKSCSIITYPCLVTRNTLCLEAKCTSYGSDASWRGSLVVKSQSQVGYNENDRNPTQALSRTVLQNDGVRRVYELDISSYIGQTVHFGVCGNFAGEIYNMWMGN